MRTISRSTFVLILMVLLASYFLRDTLKPLNFLVHKLGETMGTLNYILQVVGKILDGIRTAIGSLLSHTADAWCMFVPGPTCDARQPPKEPQTGSDLRKAPLANTQEMVHAFQHLSGFAIGIDFTKRVRSLRRKTSKSKWSNHIQEELEVEGKEAVENWDTILSSKDLAVSSTRATIQELRHQYNAIDRELRRPISWVTTFSSPSKRRRDDLRPDILTMAKSVAQNVDESRELLIECSYSSKGMKERASRLQELAGSQQADLLAVRGSLEICGFFSCSQGPDWHEADSHIKEWKDFEDFLESVYDTAVVADKMCSDLDAAMRIWTRNFNKTRGLSYDLESDSLIGPPRHPREILNTLEDTIITLEQSPEFQ